MKRFTAFILAAAIAVLFCACTNGKTLPEASELAAEIVAGLEFSDELEDSGTETAYSFYGVEPSMCKNASFFRGSSATVDEVAVFDCVDGDAAKEVLLCAEERQQYLVDGYSNYGPEQVPKINTAVIKTIGNTVIFCISDTPEKLDKVIKASYK